MVWQRDSASDVTQKIWQERGKHSASSHDGGATGSAHPQRFPAASLELGVHGAALVESKDQKTNVTQV